MGIVGSSAGGGGTGKFGKCGLQEGNESMGSEGFIKESAPGLASGQCFTHALFPVVCTIALPTAVLRPPTMHTAGTRQS